MMTYYVIMYVSNNGDGYSGVLPTLYSRLEDAETALSNEADREDGDSFDFSIQEVNSPLTLEY